MTNNLTKMEKKVLKLVQQQTRKTGSYWHPTEGNCTCQKTADAMKGLIAKQLVVKVGLLSHVTTEDARHASQAGLKFKI